MPYGLWLGSATAHRYIHIHINNVNMEEATTRGAGTLNVMRIPLRFSSLLSSRSAAEALWGGLAVGLLSIGMICRDLRLCGSSASPAY